MKNNRLHLTLSALILAFAFAALPAAADDTKGGAPAPGAPAAPAAATAEPEWIADFDKAVEAAKAQKKDMLVDFTGSDWCGWCKRLHAEVFAQSEFIEAAPKQFVLVALDFPHAPEIKAKVPNEARNKELAAKYGISGYPTILIITAEGDVVGQTGYQPGGAKPYLENLAKLSTEGHAALAQIGGIVAEFTAATGDAKLAAAGKALDLVDKLEGRGPALKLMDIVAGAAALDPDNAKGVKVRSLRMLLRAGKADDAAVADATAFDAKNENGLLELIVAQHARGVRDETAYAAFVKEARALAETGNLKDPAVYVNILAGAANIAKSKLNDLESAQAIAKVLKEKGPQDNPKLTKFLDGILAAEAPK